jgi:ribosomal protein S18 acetylase RimI-like enzyme
MIEYRTMLPGDIGAGLSLCRLSGWNQLRKDWEIFLELSPFGCRVAVYEGQVIGTVTTIKYGDDFSWIGMVLVHPTFRRQGIAKRLVDQALTILSGESNIKLDATMAGREVYLKLGFQDEYGISRMQRTGFASGNGNEEYDAREISRNDLTRIAAFDSKIFGADRMPLLESLLTAERLVALAVEKDQKLRGFCMGRAGYSHAHIGPVVANDLHTAKLLVTAALRKCTDQPVIIDATQFNADWMKWLQSIGFSEQRSFIRMYKGDNSHPGEPSKQFAILGPEFG